MPDGVSVIICCHNSAKRLPETLRHLAVQSVPEGIRWEIVVVDNASTDDTAEIAMDHWPATSPAPLRVVSEPQAGLNYARRSGILKAHYEIVSLIDDDNWVASDWILRVHSIFASNPEVGACGGQSEAMPEISPPVWFKNIQGAYAIGWQHAYTGDVTDALGTLLWGAGLNLRTAAFQDLLTHGFEFIVQDREGAQLSTGGDTEICFAMRARGWHLWYDHELRLRHFVPKERLRWDYARRLMLGLGKAAVLFDLYLSALGRPPFDACPTWKKTWFPQFLKALRQWGTLAILHPADCFFQPEGSLVALSFEKMRAQLMTLWCIRGHYQKLRDHIAQAPWTNPKQKAPRV
ncbi:MAG: glycosyltransferase [Methylacidiphilales bacterium]|nr:glycosyltransferase [Candidatus Methylacidiphilales bacterium]